MGVLLFLAKTTQKCYFMTFTHAETFLEILEKDINRFFCTKSHPLYIFGHGFKIIYENVKNLG